MSFKTGVVILMHPLQFCRQEAVVGDGSKPGLRGETLGQINARVKYTNKCYQGGYKVSLCGLYSVRKKKVDIGASDVQDLGHVRPLKKVMKDLESWLCSLSRGLEATLGGSELTAAPASENPTSGSLQAPECIPT